MADDFATITGIEAVLAATASYDVDGDVDMAKRRATALRRKLDLAQMSMRGTNQYMFAHVVTERELQRVLAYVSANTSRTEAQRKANPRVLHADYSATGKYA